jgi:predicted phage tail protein
LSAPSEDCSDIYQGERIAQIMGPTPSDRVTVGQSVQIVGSAYIDDFSSYTLDVGAGDNPSAWTPITDRRAQAVDKALLGVWDTKGLQPGRYRIRLRVVDSFQNAQESPPIVVTLNAPATPTPLPTLAPSVVVTPTRGAATSATPQPTSQTTPQPTGQATPQPTAPATPRPTPRP